MPTFYDHFLLIFFSAAGFHVPLNSSFQNRTPSSPTKDFDAVLSVDETKYGHSENRMPN
ncbi:hypothetical protein [Larkinella ripae]